MQTLANRQAAIWLSLLSVIFVLGCGKSSKRVRVFGDVSYDGKPVAMGEIVFTPEEGTIGPDAAGSIENGHYNIPVERGPYPGNYRVEVDAYRTRPQKARSMSGVMVDVVEDYLPQKYSSFETELRATINDDKKNELHFHLEK